MVIIPLTAAADDPAAKLKALTRKAKEVEGTYRAEERKLRTIDDEMSRIQGRIPRVKGDVQQKQEQIRAFDRQVEAYSAELELSREKMVRSWVTLYKSASLDMVTVYSGHEKYAGYLNAVFRHHEEILRRYQALQKRVAATREKASAVSELLRRDLAELQTSAKDLESRRAGKAALVASLKGKSREYQDEIEDLIREIQKREKEKKERLRREKERRERERKKSK